MDNITVCYPTNTYRGGYGLSDGVCMNGMQGLYPFRAGHKLTNGHYGIHDISLSYFNSDDDSAVTPCSIHTL
jgi:hypothetical protein